MIPDPVAKLVDAIRDDREHGAAELSRRAIEALRLLAVEAAPQMFGEQLEAVMAGLAAAQPEMATVQRVVEEARRARTAEQLGALCYEMLVKFAERQERAARQASELIREGELVLTHSHSATVETAMRMAHDRGVRFRVLATESRPLGEGEECAQSLRECGIEATVIPDATVYREMTEVGLVLVGADSVTPEGVVNKAGTALLALAARSRRRRMYVVCGSDKLAASAPTPGPLYDLTPLDLLTGVITEEGRMAPAALRGRFATHRLAEPRFVLDVHLGRLAAYLRMLGFDVLYATHMEDAELARISSEEERILLTRDVGLLERNAASRGYFVLATGPRKQLEEVVRHFHILPLARPFTRCLACNAELRQSSREEVRGRIPERIAETRTEFTRCPDCGKIYWRGTHYDRMVEWIEGLSSCR